MRGNVLKSFELAPYGRAGEALASEKNFRENERKKCVLF